MGFRVQGIGLRGQGAGFGAEDLGGWRGVRCLVCVFLFLFVLLFVVCCLLFVVCCCCLLFVVCCLLFVACCLLFGVCCLMFVVWCLVFGVWGLGFGVRGLGFKVQGLTVPMRVPCSPSIMRLGAIDCNSTKVMSPCATNAYKVMGPYQRHQRTFSGLQHLALY